MIEQEIPNSHGCRNLRRKIKSNRKSIIQDLQYFLLSNANEINFHFMSFYSVNYVIKNVSTVFL